MGLINRAVNHILRYKLFHFMSDKLYLQIKYWAMTSRRLDLDNPKSFNEKLQWLKLFDRDASYINMVDKLAVKDLASEVMGSDKVAKVLCTWESPEQIDLSVLPNSFVLKCNHDSGSSVVCKDKKDFDINKAIRQLTQAMQSNYYFDGREWPYRKIKPVVFAEQYIHSINPLVDYKVFCFNGIPHYVIRYSDVENNGSRAMDYYDMNWNLLSVKKPGHPNGLVISKPSFFNEIKHYSELFSKNIPFLRVDFVEADGHLFFGELTLYPSSGFNSFIPEQFDEVLGQKLTIGE